MALRGPMAPSQVLVQAYRTAGKPRDEAKELLALAEWLLVCNKPNKAIIAAEQAFALCNELKTEKELEIQTLGAVIDSLLALKKGKTALRRLKAPLAAFHDAAEHGSEAQILEIECKVHIALGNAKEALRCADDATLLFKLLQSPALEARAMQGTAKATVLEGDPVSAMKILRDAALKATQGKDVQREAACLRDLAELCLKEFIYSEALSAATSARDRSAAASDKPGEAESALLVAAVQAAQRSNDKAIRSAKAAQELFQELEDSRGEAKALEILAQCYKSMKQKDQALEAAEERLVILRELENPKSEAEGLALVASVNQHFGDLDEAEKLAREARIVARRAFDPGAEAAALLTLAEIYLVPWDGPEQIRPRLELAIHAAYDAHALAGKSGETSLRGQVLYTRGRCIAYATRYAEAATLLAQAIPFLQAAGSYLDEARALLLMAICQEESDKKELAQTTYENARTVAAHCKEGDLEAEATRRYEQVTKAIAAEKAKKAAAAPVVVAAAPAVTDAAPPTAAASIAPAAAKKGPDPAMVRKKIMALVVDVVAVDEAIELDSPLMEAGMDSLSSVSLTSLLAKEFQMSISPSIVFDFPTARALQDHILDEIAAA